MKANNYALKDQIIAVDGAVGPAIDKGFALGYKETKELVKESERVLSSVLLWEFVNTTRKERFYPYIPKDKLRYL